jgi:protease-4
MRLDRPLGAEARALLQSQIDRGYDEFLERVSSGRKKSRADIEAIAQGHVWAGTDAQRLGLVDHLGSFDAAVKAAAHRAKLTDYAPVFIEPELTWTQQLALSFRTGVAKWLFKASADQMALAQLATRLDPVAREAARLSRFSVPNRVYAYCFCEVR